MKAERVFVLRFDDGARIPYGVPDFMSEEEVADFLAHVRSELAQGAAQYFEQCCEPAKVEGSDSKAGEGKASGSKPSGGPRLGQPRSQPRLERSLTFSDNPSAETLRLEERVNHLRWLGQASLDVRARQRDAEIEAERLRIELDQQAPQMQPTQGKPRVR